MKKSEQIIIRVSPEEKAMYKKLGETVNISQVMRDTIRSLSDSKYIGLEKELLERYQLDEIKRCKDDIVYFAEHYYKIVSIRSGKQLVSLYSKQIELLRTMVRENKVICLKARQTGISTVECVYLLWRAIFFGNETSAIIANKYDTSCELISRINLAIGFLPKWLYPTAIKNTKNILKFANGSVIIGTSIRSCLSDLLDYDVTTHMMDECAFFPENSMSSYLEVIYDLKKDDKHRKFFLFSTPNGLKNRFAVYYINTLHVGKNDWTPFRIDWWDVPGRDYEWKEMQLKAFNNNRDKFDQEFGNKFLDYIG